MAIAIPPASRQPAPQSQEIIAAIRAVARYADALRTGCAYDAQELERARHVLGQHVPAQQHQQTPRAA